MAETGLDTGPEQVPRPSGDGKPAPDVAEELAALQRALGKVAASGGGQFDPVRFHFLRALAARAGNQVPGVARLLVTRAWTCLRDYESELARARDEGTELVRQLTSRYPGASETAKHLLASGDVNGIRRLAARRGLRAQHGRLRELTETLQRQPTTGDSDPDPGSLAAVMRRQESLILASLNGAGGNPGHRPTPELKSAQVLWDAQSRRHADRLVADTLREDTAETGPLNPQLLVIRSLATLRKLSPAYLNRFVTFVDTLLWLESQGDPARAAAAGKRGRKPGA